MTGTLVLRNRQRICRLNLRFLRRIMKALLIELGEHQNFELGIYLVGPREITRLNVADRVAFMVTGKFQHA